MASIGQNTYRMLLAARNGDIAQIRQHVRDNPHSVVVGRAVDMAAEQGDAQGLKVLLSVYTPVDHIRHALPVAAARGHLACVEILLGYVQHLFDKEHILAATLQNAAQSGHADCVELLMQKAHPMYDDGVALARAALNGHTECVRHLVAFSNPKKRSSEALGWAVQGGHVACVDVLWHVSDARKVLQSIPQGFMNEAGQHLQHLVDAQEQSAVLREHMDTRNVVVSQRSKI